MSSRTDRPLRDLPAATMAAGPKLQAGSAADRTPRARSCLRFWSVAAALFALNAAGILWTRNEVSATPVAKVRVLRALPEKDIDRTGRLSLVFDKPMAVTEEIERPLAEPLFVVKPEAEGHWEWTTPRRLDFVLAKPLLPGRTYRVIPAVNFEQRSGRRLVGEQTFTFVTRSLRVLTSRLESYDRENVTFGVSFNQPVHPEDLVRCVRVWSTRGGTPRDVVALTKTAAEKVTFRIARLGATRLTVEIAPDLAGHGADRSLGNRYTRSFALSRVFTLLGADVRRPSLGRTATVDLRLSSRPDRSQVPPRVEFSPPVGDVHVSIGYRSLRLVGPFESGVRYVARVTGRLVSRDGQLLGEGETVRFAVPDRRPALRFKHRRGILMPGGGLELEVEAVNVSGVRFEAWRVHENNLVAHARGAQRGATGRALGVETLPLALPRNRSVSAVVDIKRLLEKPLGVYRIEARATDRRWTRDEAIVTVSDLGLTAKREADGLMVWVTSLATGRPVEAARVSVRTYSNQALGSALTGADGTARIATPPEHPDGAPWIVIAEHGRDMNFLLPDRARWALEGADLSGREIPRTYDVMLYPERGAYRPGDAVHLTGIVRDAFGRVPPAFPLRVKAARPDGRLAAETTVTPAGGQGVFHCDIPTGDDWRTGRYGFAAMLPGSEKAIGRTNALVEAFVPVRIEVKAGLGRERFVIDRENAIGDAPELEVFARYLFGRAASELALAVDGGFSRVPFRSKRHPGFSFAPAVATGRVKIPGRKLKLDGDGAATVPLAEALPKEAGLWRLGVSATVTEDGGRSVSAKASATVDTSGRHVGMRLAERYARAGDPVRVEWVALDSDDAPARGGRVEFTLDRIHRDWIWQEVNGRRTWRSLRREERVLARTFDVPEGAEPASFELTCPTWGNYLLRARDERSGSATQVSFCSTNPAWGGGRMTLDHPERLEIVLDRKEGAPGSRAKALVRSPFPGTMLLALETDRVIEKRIVEMKTCEAEVGFDVPADLRGGAFVTATVVRAIDPGEKSWTPHRAMGVARLATRHDDRRLKMKIDAPDEARPGAEVAVSVETRAPADAARPGWVHLWAVDEGLLLVTSQRTPDPHGHFLAARRAGVWSSDCFGGLLPDFERPENMDRIGAGSAGRRAPPPGAEALRRNPIAATRREPAVVWRAAREVGPDGTATFRLAMPEVTGAMRIMAVAVDGDSYGSAARRMELTAPLLVEASWPRFAAPGDSFRVPVKLFNNTGAPFRAELGVEVDGPVAIKDRPGARSIFIGPGASTLLKLDAKALSLGPVTGRVVARARTAAGEEVEARSSAEFCVRPAGPIQSETRFARARAGDPIEIALPGEFLSGTARTTLTVGAEPLVEIRPAVRALIGYPYGCVEQTTSRLYAMVYAPQLLAKDDRDGEATRAFDVNARRRRCVEEMVQAGIDRLWSMQTPAGGLGYWPGASKPHPWGTGYASFFLLQAKQAGFRVPEQFVKPLLAYLERSLSSDNGLDANTRALYVNVLAGFGRPQHGWMARLSEMLGALDIAGRANLAAAWHHSGRGDRARDALPEGTLDLAAETSTGGRITSRVRQEAVLLLALLEINPRHDWIPPLAERVNVARKGRGYWGSTLENATALAALARYQASGASSADFAGTVETPGGGKRRFSSAAPLTLTFDAGGRPVRIRSEGKGFLFVSAETEGLSTATAASEYDRRIRVRRRWTDAEGRDVDPLAVRVGDLVNVETTLSAPGFGYGRWVHNIAVVDALPGGLEVENPRLSTSTANARRGSSPCDHVEFLDDRVVVFTSISRQPRTFRYSLRAVAEGDYALPPVQASCMYDAGCASVNGAGRMRVGPMSVAPAHWPGAPDGDADAKTSAAPGRAR